MMRHCIAILLLSCTALLAQTSSTQERNSFQELIGDFAMIQEMHDTNRAAFASIDVDLGKLFKSPNSEESIKQAIRIRRRTAELMQSIERNQERQVAFKNALTNYAATRQLLRQEQSYLTHYLDELQKFGAEQADAMRFLQNATKTLTQVLASTQPPPRFTVAPGIEFVLVGAPGKTPLYVTATALTEDQTIAFWRAANPNADENALEQARENLKKDGCNLLDVTAIAATATKLAGFECTLPEEAQLQLLKGYAPTLDKAVWIGGKPQLQPQLQPHEREALQRFDMKMGRIWDPRGLLRRKTSGIADVSSELPWASYPELGCILVANVQAGRKTFLEKIEESMVAEDEAARKTPDNAPAPMTKREEPAEATQSQEDPQ